MASKESDFLIVNMMRQLIWTGWNRGRIPREFGLDFDIAGKTGTTQHSWARTSMKSSCNHRNQNQSMSLAFLRLMLLLIMGFRSPDMVPKLW